MDARVRLDQFNAIPLRNVADKPRHSWTPQNLITLAKSPPEPPSIGGILYPGKRTLISGETEALKTWLALIFAKAEIQAGFHVAWVDLDDMGPNALLQRLRALELEDEQIADMFLYYQPEERLADDRLTDALLQLTVTGCRMMVIDAFTPILALHGLDPNNAIDIEKFWRDVCDPIAKVGVAPTILDHVVKNADSRSKYSTGSERKASGATVHIGVQLLEALAIGGTGRSVLHVHKDRPGYLPRPTLGRLVLTSDGDKIGYELEEDKAHEGGGFKPTFLMERVSRTLEIQPDAVSQRWVEENVKGKGSALRDAVQKLVEGGHLEDTPGPRNTRLLTTLKAYREADDDTENDRVPTASPPRPWKGAFGESTASPRPRPPVRGRGGTQSASGAEDAVDFEPTASPQNGHLENGHHGNVEDLFRDAFLDTEPDPQEDT